MAGLYTGKGGYERYSICRNSLKKQRSEGKHTYTKGEEKKCMQKSTSQSVD